tara:strand:- start:797 stop:1144 length:348 start_codon:yes stop_codon:yes gene_type:complete
MKTVIEVTLQPLPYEHNVVNLAGYLQSVISEMTGTQTLVDINDFDFTDKMSIFRSMRRPSPTHQNNALSRSGITITGSNSMSVGFQASSISNVASASAHRGHGGPMNRTNDSSWR